MNNKFKAIVLNQSGDKFSREVKNLDTSFFKSGNVLVKVDYSGLNYKDALILRNGAKLVKEYPHIPGIDFSGQVKESDSLDFKPGDEVVVTGSKVGELYPGGYSQLVKVKSELLVKKPKSISNKNAMILGTAGFTSLLCAFAIKAREELLLGEKVKDVLVTGATGGVGSIAIMVLSKFGYKVSAVTGKKDKSNYLKELGASNIIEISELNKWYGDFHALKNINMNVKEGEIIVVCGPSGSGKSTLIRCVYFLEKFQEGNIVVAGIELTDDAQKIRKIRSEVAMVFHLFNLFPHLGHFVTLEKSVLHPGQ